MKFFVALSLTTVLAACGSVNSSDNTSTVNSTYSESETVITSNPFGYAQDNSFKSFKKMSKTGKWDFNACGQTDTDEGLVAGCTGWSEVLVDRQLTMVMVKCQYTFTKQPSGKFKLKKHECIM